MCVSINDSWGGVCSRDSSSTPPLEMESSRGREWSAVFPVRRIKKKKVAWWMEAAAEHVTGARALTPLSPPAHLPVLVYKQRLSINRRCLPYQSVAGPFVVRGLSARLVCRPRSALVLGAEGQYLLFVPIDRTPGFSAIGIT